MVFQNYPCEKPHRQAFRAHAGRSVQRCEHSVRRQWEGWLNQLLRSTTRAVSRMKGDANATIGRQNYSLGRHRAKRVGSEDCRRRWILLCTQNCTSIRNANGRIARRTNYANIQMRPVNLTGNQTGSSTLARHSRHSGRSTISRASSQFAATPCRDAT